MEREEDFSMMEVYDATLWVDIYFSFGKDQPLLSFLTPVAENFKANVESMAYILERNMSIRFGKFALEKDSGIWLEYSMFGERWDAKSFLIVLKNIFETARKYKQELRKQKNSAITSQWLSDEAAEWLESRRAKKRKR